MKWNFKRSVWNAGEEKLEVVPTDYKFNRTLLIEKAYKDETGQDLSEQLGFIQETLIDDDQDKNAENFDEEAWKEANRRVNTLEWHDNLVEIMSWLWYDTDANGKIIQSDRTREKFVEKLEEDDEVGIHALILDMFRHIRG